MNPNAQVPFFPTKDSENQPYGHLMKKKAEIEGGITLFNHFKKARFVNPHAISIAIAILDLLNTRHL